MTLGRDFAMVTAFKAVCTGLFNAGCDHLEHLEVKDVDHYWQAPTEANLVSNRFFDSFWSMGGNDMAIMSAALSRGKVMFCFVSSHVQFLYFIILSLFSLHYFFADLGGKASYSRFGGKFLDEMRSAREGGNASPTPSLAASPAPNAETSAEGAARNAGDEGEDE